MTAFTLPPFAVAWDARWVGVDLHGDLEEWARAAALDVLARAGHRGYRYKSRQVIALLKGAGELARQADDASIALLLYPSLDQGVRAVARFCPVDLDGQDGAQAWLNLIAMVSLDLPGQEEAEVVELDTPAGACRRVRQREAKGDGRDRPVIEHLAYVWMLPAFGAGVILTTAFADLTDASRWRPAFDELAATAETDQPGGAGPG